MTHNTRIIVKMAVSALVSAAITTLTTLASALTQGPLTETVLYVATIGGALAFLKDMQAYLSVPPRPHDGG